MLKKVDYEITMKIKGTKNLEVPEDVQVNNDAFKSILKNFIKNELGCECDITGCVIKCN